MRRHHLGRTAPQLSDAIGIGVRYTDLRDFTGSEVDAEDATGHDVTAIEQPTRMHTDCQAGVITGCHGGFENVLTLGLSVDTLDFEPDPYSGLLAQAVAEFSGKALGSDFEYERVTFSTSAYRTLFPNLARLVLAGRALYSMQFGNVPFFSLPTLDGWRADYGIGFRLIWNLATTVSFDYLWHQQRGADLPNGSRIRVLSLI